MSHTKIATVTVALVVSALAARIFVDRHMPRSYFDMLDHATN